MVDATVSMVLRRLAPMIERRVREEVCLLLNSNDEADKLSSRLKKIEEVLRDAERKGLTDPKVKSWLDKLQEISYEIDDVLDEREWENIKLELEELEDASEPSSSDPLEKVSSFIQSICLCFRRVVERRDISLKIKQLNERLNSIAKENEDEFKFIPNVSSDDSLRFKPPPTTSFVDVSEVHGRSDDKEILVSKLLSESSSQMENGLQVISIVGSGGIGKSTLAQLVFSDEKIKDLFQERIWVCVSHPFDGIKIAKTTLEELNKKSPEVSQFESLLQCIMDDISRKNFLLVLDDVWTEDDTMWKPLKISLKNGAPSSRILVTTRKTKVAKMMGSTEVQIYSWSPLSDSYCWSVLSQIAFHGKTEWDRKVLETTGWEIVKKCKGLPLAAKTIGGLLHEKNSLEEWRKVLESQVWELEIAGTGIFPFLVLSYDELRTIAKLCFSYCATFPKDTRIEVDMLIRMWCAQGFLSMEGSSGDMELKGREIFDDLAMRSFFQDFQKDDIGNHIISCQMHDIIHDFARFLTKHECLIVENVDGGKKLVCNQNARHLTLLLDIAEANRNPISVHHKEHRRFLSIDFVFPPNSLIQFKRVRELILCNCELNGIPSEIGSLIHLRYLDVSRNPIEQLPETIRDLYNLQTLKLEYCHALTRHPEGISKLRKLRHLLNDGTVIEFPQGIEELTNLWTLSEISISSTWKNLGFLRNLNNLHGSLRTLTKLPDCTDGIFTAEKADLKKKKFIGELILFHDGISQDQVIEALQPNPNLQILHCMGLYLPKWITTLTSLRKLTIEGDSIRFKYYLEMRGFSSLPPLGKLLPYLEDLCLQEMSGMERLSHEFLGIDTAAAAATPQPAESHVFPRLKRLSFIYCIEWKEWEDISEEEEDNINISILPCLERLEFTRCPELKALPHRLLHKASSLKYLRVRSCNYLYQRYASSASKDGDKISQILHVSILRN